MNLFGITFTAKRNSVQSVVRTCRTSSTADERDERWALSGLEFEKYIITRFSKDANRLLDWRGDKYIAGYGGPESSRDPDVLFSTRSERDKFAIECKFRSNWWYNPHHGPCIEWAREDQLDRYWHYENRRGIPVYIAIGVGGSPSDPAELFIGRLAEIKYRIARKHHLEQYRKQLPLPKGGLEFA